MNNSSSSSNRLLLLTLFVVTSEVFVNLGFPNKSSSESSESSKSEATFDFLIFWSDFGNGGGPKISSFSAGTFWAESEDFGFWVLEIDSRLDPSILEWLALEKIKKNFYYNFV